MESIRNLSMELTKLFKKYKRIGMSSNLKQYNILTQNNLTNIIDTLTNRLSDFGYKILDTPNNIDVIQDADYKNIDDNYVTYTFRYIVKNPIKI